MVIQGEGGSISGSSHQSSTSSIRREEGWEDLEPDVENISFKSLLDDEIFSDVQLMLDHCKAKYSFNLVKIQKDLGLDFLESIKLVNYVRSVVQNENRIPVVSGKEDFEDSKYLYPFLEDDALLYSLDDLEHETEDTSAQQPGAADLGHDGYASNLDKDHTNIAVTALAKDPPERITGSCRTNLAASELSLELLHVDNVETTTTTNMDVRSPERENDDSHYYASYGYHDIHETMLKDTVRTDAYRDLIYDNKHLVHGKTVLDVGCGTGILSMFCARAGARKVYAVDKSDIIQKARENVFENGFQDIIICISGTIEEVTLPTDKVDVIVSEWMGYCLLYEAMLDSVIWARDRYLVHDGLMIPSHAILRIAPIHDPEYIMDSISFWKSVYGFSMSSMTAHIYDDVLVRDLPPETIAADSQPFLHLPLHHATKEDLSFSRNPFSLELKEDIDSLDGFAIWFDMFFAPSPRVKISMDNRADEWAMVQTRVAFTTGPGGRGTHWKQGALLIDHGKKGPRALKKGQVVEGSIGYQKARNNARELDIGVIWKISDKAVGTSDPREGDQNTLERGEQVWFMR